MNFKILDGANFRDTDGSIKTAGDTIELDADFAAQHHDKVVKLDDPEPSNAAQTDSPTPAR